jgi:hypothetical protein
VLRSKKAFKEGIIYAYVETARRREVCRVVFCEVLIASRCRSLGFLSPYVLNV